MIKRLLLARTRIIEACRKAPLLVTLRKVLP